MRDTRNEDTESENKARRENRRGCRIEARVSQVRTPSDRALLAPVSSRIMYSDARQQPDVASR